VNVDDTRGQTLFKVHKTPTPKSFEIKVPRIATDREVMMSSPFAVANRSTAVVSLVPPKGTHWIAVSLDDKVKQAKILFALELAASKCSFSSYADFVEVCKSAFRYSQVAQHM